MSPTRVEELIALIPRRAPYLRRVSLQTHRQYGTPVEVDVYASAKNDPTFGWLFIKCFIDTGEVLPGHVTESFLLRTYCYARYGNGDREVRLAMEIEHGTNWQRRALLKCMLLLPDHNYKKIADFLNLPEDTVGIYETLFWNVRDQLKDQVYVNMLVFPDSRQVELGQHYALAETPTNLMMRASQQHGLKAALEFAGIENPTIEFDAQAHAKSFEARILSTGNFLARMGFLHQHDLAAIHSARSVLNSIKLGGEQQKDDDSRRGLAGMSLGMAVNESFKRIMMPDVERRMAIQRGIEIEDSKKAAATVLENN